MLYEVITLDGVRGVRVSRLGVAPTLRDGFASYLASRGVDPRRVGEAMVLASKVQSCAGTIAELCWSDDPSYVTGYVAAGDTYHRISPLKEAGDPFGGRAFFIRPGTDLGELVTYLERTPRITSYNVCYTKLLRAAPSHRDRRRGGRQAGADVPSVT